MKQYIQQNDKKIRIEIPADSNDKNDTKLENQQPNIKKEVHILFE